MKFFKHSHFFFSQKNEQIVSQVCVCGCVGESDFRKTKTLKIFQKTKAQCGKDDEKEESSFLINPSLIRNTELPEKAKPNETKSKDRMNVRNLGVGEGGSQVEIGKKPSQSGRQVVNETQVN